MRPILLIVALGGALLPGVLPAQQPARPRPLEAAGTAAPLTRRERVFSLVGTLVGAGAAYAACTARRPPGLTREGLALVGAGCGLFGGVIGYTIGGLAGSTDGYDASASRR